VSWAIDFFSVTALCFATICVFLVFELGRRPVLHGAALFLRHCGLREVRTALQSPWQNPYVEHFIGTLRRELRHHVIVLSEAHLDRLLRKLIEDYYHVARPHQGLAGETPIQGGDPRAADGPTRLAAVPLLGDPHHRYVCVAA
jgi:hypothetical protein